MARADLAGLYQSLVQSHFGFVGTGEFSIDTIYERVHEEYPALCDDSYLCSSNCGGVHHQPEWRHVTRKALSDLYRRNDGIEQGHQRRFWLIGESPSEFFDLDEEFSEGRELLLAHKRAERNRNAVRRKKNVVLALTGQLVCEACDVDPELVYGAIGRKIAECHHRLPLRDLDGPRRTRLRDLAIICPSCHRFLHQTSPMLTVEELHSLILARRVVGSHE